MKIIYQTKNPFQTKKLGEILAKEILKTKLKNNAFVLGLEGDLGGGKTTFLQGFAKGLGVKQKITSPTFIIMRRFRIQNSKYKNLYHFDCYRIKESKDILSLGFKDIISDPQNIVAIEWAERIKEILPKDRISLKFGFVNKKNRKIIIKSKNGK